MVLLKDFFWKKLIFKNMPTKMQHKITNCLPCHVRKTTTWALNIWALMRENLSTGFANNKGADQSAHPCRLISAFVIGFWECDINKHAKGEISIIQLDCVAEETGLNLTLLETLKTGFVASRPIYYTIIDTFGRLYKDLFT